MNLDQPNAKLLVNYVVGAMRGKYIYVGGVWYEVQPKNEHRRHTRWQRVGKKIIKRAIRDFLNPLRADGVTITYRLINDVLELIKKPLEAMRNENS